MSAYEGGQNHLPDIPAERWREMYMETAGMASVMVGLLREVIGPLEVSAAMLEDEDGGERFEALLGHVRAVVAQWDAAAVEALG